MEAFLRGTKRKSSAIQEDVVADDDGESTDVKLAILSSLFSDISQEALLETLLAHDGSVEAASLSLADGQVPSPRKSPAKGAIGSQTSLRFFASRSSEQDPSISPKKPRLLSKKGATLHLYDPLDIAEHTPCSIIHNFLPQEEANALLEEMLEESKTFEKNTFQLFEIVVSSPHTSTFYVETQAELDTQIHEYFYNGARVSVSFLSPFLSSVHWRCHSKSCNTYMLALFRPAMLTVSRMSAGSHLSFCR